MALSSVCVVDGCGGGGQFPIFSSLLWGSRVATDQFFSVLQLNGAMDKFSNIPPYAQFLLRDNGTKLTFGGIQPGVSGGHVFGPVIAGQWNADVLISGVQTHGHWAV